MANRPLRLVQAVDRAKLLRIDHSDVYFTNDRLDEELSSDLDSILYQKCRQRIAMDSEISQLRKACRPRSFVGSNSIRGKSQAEDSRISNGTNTVVPSKPRISISTARLNSSTKGPSAGVSPETQVGTATQRVPGENRTKAAWNALGPDSAFGLQRGTRQNAENRAEPNANKFKVGRLETSESDDDSDSVCSDDFSDDSDNSSSSSTNGFDSNGNKNWKEVALLRDQQKVSKGNTKKNKTIGWKQTETGRSVENSNGKPTNKFKTAKGKDGLMINLAFLRLDSVPFQWFSSVVQPRDSTLGRRPKTAKASGQLDSTSRSRPQTSVGILRTNASDFLSDDQTDNRSAQGPEEDPTCRHFQPSPSKLSRKSSFFERSRPKVNGKSRRQLVEQAQVEAGDILDYYAEKQRKDLKRQQEKNAAEQVNLNLKVKEFVRSVEQMNNQTRKRGILERLVHGLPLD